MIRGSFTNVVIAEGSRRSGCINLSLHSGQTMLLETPASNMILRTLLAEPGYSILSGKIHLPGHTLICDRPHCLDNLTTAEVLKAIHMTHNPDDWELFRPKATLALKGLALGPKIMSKTLGSHTPDDRLNMEYLALNLKPWRLAIVAHLLPQTPEQKAYLTMLMKERDGAILQLGGLSDS